jgi:hypothetical protein
MGHREKDQADFDLETFVDLFDTAMSSDNPAVQRALKNLVLISAMVNAQSPENLRKGPLRRVVEDVQILNKRLSNLESAGAYRGVYAPNTGTPIPGGYAPNTGTPIPAQVVPNTNWPTTLPGTIPPGTIISGPLGPITSGTTNATQSKSFVDGHGDVFDIKVNTLLEKLESK